MVLPDSVPLSSSFTEVVIPIHHWSMEEGGCEGIHHVIVIVIPQEDNERQEKETQQHWKRFPNRKIKHNSWYL
jgi:hypothetical protein